jgi:DNA-binding beta-propeller fold protein YncE/Tfp pilus assembly protein PilF
MKHLAAAVFFAVLSVRAYGYDDVQYVRAYDGPELAAPAAIAAKGDKAYVVDGKTGSLIVLSLADGKVLSTLGGKKGSDKSQFVSAAVAEDGTVYASDAAHDSVAIFDKDGKNLGWIGGKGSEPGQLRGPAGVAIGPDGRVYVAETRNSRVSVFGKDGIFLDSFGDGNLSKPVKLQVDPSENVYVLDGGALIRFEPHGLGWKPVRLKAMGVGFAVEQHGWMYALDAELGKVKEYTPAGASENAFGTQGTGVGQLQEATDLAYVGDGDVLITDPGNKRILRFHVENAKRGDELPPNRQTKIALTGPVWEAQRKVGPFVPLKEGLIGYDLEKKELVKLDEKGNASLEFGKYGKEKGQVRDPRSVAWSESLGVFVTDTGNSRIQFFSQDGKPTGLFGEKSGWFSSRSKEGNVNEPEGVAITEKGNLFIADTGNSRIQEFSKEGAPLKTIGPKIGDVTLSEPCALQWDPKGRLFVLDRKIKKIIELEPSGKFVKSWGKTGETIDAWESPVAFAYDGHNYLYVLDQEAARLKVYDTDGRWVANFFSRGQSAKSLVQPAALAFQGSRLYISDPGRSKVASYDVRPVLAPPALVAKAASGKVNISWEASNEPWVKTYHVARATKATGPFEELKTTEDPSFTDAPEDVYMTYYYRVSVEAKTGDIGPASAAAGLYVPGSFNAPPVQIGKIDLDYVFSANYKYYLSHPVGELTIENNQEQSFQNVKLTFFLKDFMDFPSTIDVPELAPRAKTKVALKATLNNKILDVSEDTPILAEFKVTYFEQGKEQSFTRTKPIKVASRNAIIWDHTERMANFVTPNDDPIVDFRAAALNADPKPKNAPHNANLNNALAIWSAAAVAGVGYQPDALHPYESVKGDESHPLDRVQFARETLRRKSGECKDLVALFASLFEAGGIPTALLDYPGHIAVAIDLKTGDPLEAGVPADTLLKHGDSLWLPIETTMAGKPFTQAVDQAASTWRKMASSKDAHFIALADARKSYDPVSLAKEEWRADSPDKAKLQAAFKSDAEKLDEQRFALLKRHYQKMLDADSQDRTALLGLGILEAQSGKSDDAKKHFEAVLSADSGDASALNNLGNLAYAKGNYKEASASYEKAAAADGSDAGILLNVARAKVKLGDSSGAKSAVDAAVKLDASLKPIGKAVLELK